MSNSAGRKEGFRRAVFRTSMIAGFVPKVGGDGTVVLIQGQAGGETTAVPTEVYFVDLVATSPIALSGTPTIDGVATSGGVRVLVMANAEDDECGIFEIGADWNRITGFTRPFHVQVTGGTLGTGTFWYTPDGSSFAIVYSDVRDGSITTAKLADSAVTEEKVAADAITEDHIGSGVFDVALEGGSGTRVSVRFDGESVGVNGSNQLEVPVGGIGSSKIAENAVTSGKIADAAVTVDKIDASTITASPGDVLTYDGSGLAWTTPAAPYTDEKAQDALYAAFDIGRTFGNIDVYYSDVANAIGFFVKVGGIGSSELASNAVTSAKIAANAVTTAKIADDAVTGDKIGDGQVFTGNIADGNVTADKLASGAVTSSKIASSAVTSDRIADAAVTPAKIDSTGASTGYVLSFDGSSVVWSAPAAGYTDEQVMDVVAAMELAGDGFGNVKSYYSDVGNALGHYVAAGGIGSNELASNAVTAAKIASNAVTETKIGSGAVTNGKIGSAAVTFDKIADGAVTLGKLDTSGAGTNYAITFNGSSVVWSAPSRAGATILTVDLGNSGITVPAGSTRYITIGRILADSNESNQVYYLSRPGQLRDLFVRATGTQPDTGDLIITVRMNYGSTSIGTQIPAEAGGGNYLDILNTQDAGAGDILCFQLANGASSASITIHQISVSF